MLYPCRSVTLMQVPRTIDGSIKEPLCNTCASRDCENNIEKRKVSLPGGQKQWRVLMAGRNVQFVVQCEGYQSR